MAIENFYIECTIKRPTEVIEYGRVTKTYTEIDINGYKGSQTDTIGIVADKNTIISKYKFFSDTPLIYGDILVYEDEQYELASDSKNTAHKNHHYKTYIRKVENIKQ